jgi:hypothetical protein
MRTKALLLAAAFTVATCATSMAQVYSANAVGYVNLTLPAGFNIIANPLNGTNNNLNTVLPLPDTATGAALYKFDATTQNYGGAQTFIGGFGWVGTDLDLDPGVGAFLDVPGAVAPLNITFVGEVPQGQQDMNLIGGGAFNLIASKIPQALPLGPGDGTLNFPAVTGDAVYFFNAGSQTFGGANTYIGGFGWAGLDSPTPAGPVPAVGQGFFVQKAGADVAWERDFTVN